jgi:hypothetical protein
MLLDLLAAQFCRVSRVRSAPWVRRRLDDERTLCALAVAWRVTVIATAALYAALAIAPVWDNAGYLRELGNLLFVSEG